MKRALWKSVDINHCHEDDDVATQEKIAIITNTYIALKNHCDQFSRHDVEFI